MAISKLNLTSTALAVVMSVSLASFATTASAGKGGVNANKQGPRASVDSLTTCALDGTNLVVTLNVTDKSSGDAVAVVKGYDIQPTYKDHDLKGNANPELPGLGDSINYNPAEEVADGWTGSGTYNLCDALAADTDNKMPGLRAINAVTTVSYGIDGGETRTVTNMCGDDPATEEVEPAGIKISYDELVNACLP